jgi:hypothetical protein
MLSSGWKRGVGRRKEAKNKLVKSDCEMEGYEMGKSSLAVVSTRLIVENFQNFGILFNRNLPQLGNDIYFVRIL